MNKGGCKVGKKSDLGGCKIGKKNPPAKKKPKFKVKPAVAEPVKKKPKFKVKPAVVAPIKKKPKFKVKAPAKPKKLVSDEKMARMQRKVAILNRKEVALKKKKARETGNTAKKLTEEKAPAPKKPIPKEVSEAKLPKIKKGEIQTELMGQFGLTNKQANSMSALKLFGLLSPEVKKIILDPKTTGTKVGRISASKLGEEELIEDNPKMSDDWDEVDSYWSALTYSDSWNEVLPKAQARFYSKHYANWRDQSIDDEKIYDRMEELENKIHYKVSNRVYSDRRKAVRAWKKKNKGLTGTLLELQEKFADFYASY